MKDQKLIGFVFAAIGAMAFSSKAVLIKLAYEGEIIDSLSLLTIRMMFSFPLYVIVLIVLWKRSQLYVSFNDLLKIMVLATVGYYGASFLDFSGLKYLSASVERLVLFIYPTFVVVINYVIFRKPISGMKFMAIGLTYVGLAVVFSDQLGDSKSEQLLTGVALVVSSALAYSVYLVGSEQLLKRIGVFSFTSVAMIVSSIGVFIHYGVVNHSIELMEFKTSTYLYGASIAFFATVIPSFLISKAISLVGSSKVAVISSLGPVSTVTGAWLFLDESVTFTLFVGAALVICGVVLLTRTK